MTVDLEHPPPPPPRLAPFRTVANAHGRPSFSFAQKEKEKAVLLLIVVYCTSTSTSTSNRYAAPKFHCSTIVSDISGSYVLFTPGGPTIRPYERACETAVIVAVMILLSQDPEYISTSSVVCCEVERVHWPVWLVRLRCFGPFLRALQSKHCCTQERFNSSSIYCSILVLAARSYFYNYIY